MKGMWLKSAKVYSLIPILSPHVPLGKVPGLVDSGTFLRGLVGRGSHPQPRQHTSVSLRSAGIGEKDDTGRIIAIGSTLDSASPVIGTAR